MGIFDFFKRKKQEFEEQTEEKISFKEIDNWINEKKQKIKDNQKEPLQKIKENLSELLDGLDDKIEVLRNFDLDKKKAPERAKLIVKENFNKFIDYLEKLIFDLKDLKVI